MGSTGMLFRDLSIFKESLQENESPKTRNGRRDHLFLRHAHPPQSAPAHKDQHDTRDLTVGFIPGPRTQVGQCHWVLGWTGCPSATWLWAPHDEDRTESTQGWPPRDTHGAKNRPENRAPELLPTPGGCTGEGSGSTLRGVSQDLVCTPLASEFKVSTSAKSSNWTSGPYATYRNRKRSFCGTRQTSRRWAAANSPHHRPTQRVLSSGH